MEIGAQLYTIRDYCKDLDSFSESLAKLADIGYKNVQVSGTCDYEPAWLEEQLKKNGLKCVLTHIPSDKLVENPAKVAEDHSVFGCNNVGLGWYKFDEQNENESFDNFFKTYLPVADALYENGKYFMYHNHDQEFQKRDGKIILEHIAERFPKEKLGFTLDTFWVQAGGADPGYWLEQLSGRVPVIHLKDYSFGRKMAVIGEGNINFDRVFEKAEKAGTKYMLVEQDDCNGENPFDCLKRSYKYLESRGF
ncbi:MAG: sugar phosphate isomerase/epimerase family protein [Acutalibacteraceae bacterium]